LLRKPLAHISPSFPRNDVLTFLFITLIFLFPKISFSQIDTSQATQEKQDDLLEQLTENGENQTLDYDDIVDLQNSLTKHPINLNKASKEDFQPLLDLRLLNDIQINSILSYR